MSPRSGHQYTQDGFIPAHPLPGMPHKNSKVGDALKFAMAWGCKMRIVNSNDIGVSHRLIPSSNLVSQRAGLAVSLSRRDTPQALVSFLRKVQEKVLELVPEPVMAVHTTHQNNQPLSPRFGEVVRVDADKNGRPIVPNEYLPPNNSPSPVQPIKYPPSTLSHPTADAAEAVLREIIEQVHYQNHCYGQGATAIDPIKFIGFSSCPNEMCKRAREALGNIRALGETITDVMCEREAIRADLQAAQCLLNEAAQVPTPQTVRIAPEVNTANGTVTGNGAGLFPSGVWITPEDDAEARSTKYELMLDVLRSALIRIDPHLDRNVLDAVEQAIQRSGYDREWEVAFRILNFNRFRRQIQAQVRTGKTRNMVGNTRWMEFQRAAEKLRFQSIGWTGPAQPENSGA